MLLRDNIILTCLAFSQWLRLRHKNSITSLTKVHTLIRKHKGKKSDRSNTHTRIQLSALRSKSWQVTHYNPLLLKVIRVFSMVNNPFFASRASSTFSVQGHLFLQLCQSCRQHKCLPCHPYLWGWLPVSILSITFLLTDWGTATGVNRKW